MSESGTDSDCPVGAEGCRCGDADACDSGLLCVQSACVDPGEETTLTTSTAGTETSMSSSTDSTSSDTGTTDTTGDPVECDPEAPADVCATEDPTRPYCGSDGKCTDCSGIASCADLNSETPLCNAATGLCSECTAEDPSPCAGDEPVCDGALGECVSCSADADCGSGVCSPFTGLCFRNEVWVDGAFNNCAASDGSMAAPFCEVEDAFVTLGFTPTIINIRAGVYLGSLTVQGSQSVALRRASPADVVEITTENGTGLTLLKGARAIVDGVRFTSNNFGVDCTEGELQARGSRFSDSDVSGIRADACNMTLLSSVVADNFRQGIEVTGGELTLVNSFVSLNGLNVTDGGGIMTFGGVDLTLNYVTMFKNSGSIGGPGSIICTGSPTVYLRNSIIVGESPDSIDEDCLFAADSLAYDYSQNPPDVGNGQLLQLSMMNINGILVTVGTDAQSGVLRPQPGINPIQSLGEWSAGDPLTDFDGDPRPAQEGAPDYAGADRIK